MSWNREFHQEKFKIPDNVLGELKRLGFEDESWHNDVSPHFTKPHPTEPDKIYQFWTDAVDVQDREFQEHARFTLVLAYPEDTAPVFATELPDIAAMALHVVFG